MTAKQNNNNKNVPALLTGRRFQQNAKSVFPKRQAAVLLAATLQSFAGSGPPRVGAGFQDFCSETKKNKTVLVLTIIKGKKKEFYCNTYVLQR